MSAQKQQDDDISARLKELAAEGRLEDIIVNMLAAADEAVMQFEGTGVMMRAVADPPISDKSCYKKCLREDIKNPGSYGNCIKKCRPTTKLVLEFTAV
jgi:hypothetical protein